MGPSTPSSYHFPSPSPTDSKSEKVLIFFITGNPGLIAYYETFLSHLHALLSTSLLAKSDRFSFDVYGRSLLGFEASGQPTGQVPSKWNDQRGDKNETTPPFGLQAQIEAIERSVKQVVQDEKEKGGRIGKVILIGHSVGAYILLEVLRRHRERLAEWKNGNGHSRVREGVREPDDGLRIAGGVCLFPTVTHIAKSKSGRRLGWLFALPITSLIGSWIVKLLFLLVPRFILTGLIRVLLRFPADAAATTSAFLKSPNGVREALYMAKHEMVTITEDAWDAEIWGAAHSSPSPFPRPRLFFLFGKEDHWVANETRDDLIKARAGEEDWKPQMEVDEEKGWPHGFSIRHSVPVAKKVKGYIEEIVRLS